MVLVCVLDLLGRNAQQVPRIEILEERPRGVSANAAAFTDLDERVIYLIASASPFSEARSAQSSPAQCREVTALKLVASIIVHEEWHLQHGPDEEGAYRAALRELQRLGLGPDTPTYLGVQRAMLSVLEAQSKP